jgi:hypothetical protein
MYHCVLQIEFLHVQIIVFPNSCLALIFPHFVNQNNKK